MRDRVLRPRYDEFKVPDVLLALYDWVIAWDHAAGRAWVISTGIPERGASAARRAASRLAFVRDRLADGPNARGLPERLRRFVAQGDPRRAHRAAAPSYPVPDVPGVRSNFTREGYLDAIARVIEYVYAGDIFQANLSQRLEAPLVGTPLELYRRLRNRNPAPFSAYLDFGDLVGASSHQSTTPWTCCGRHSPAVRSPGRPRSARCRSSRSSSPPSAPPTAAPSAISRCRARWTRAS